MSIEHSPNAFHEQAIRERAHLIWEEEGRPTGKDLEHWFDSRKGNQLRIPEIVGGDFAEDRRMIVPICRDQ